MQRSLIRYAAFALLPVMLVGCTMTTPSQLRTGQIQMQENAATYAYPLAEVSDSQLRSIAHDHDTRGRGAAAVTVAYQDGDTQALKASQKKMRHVLSVLEREGMTGTTVHYVAVNDASLAGQAVFAYPALYARAPDHCKRMPGYQGAGSLDDIEDYQISCESKEMLSRMIARPTDLLGNDGKGPGTGRRSGAVVETYQDGEANKLFYPIATSSDAAGN